jgi:hypothetical protein
MNITRMPLLRPSKTWGYPFYLKYEDSANPNISFAVLRTATFTLIMEVFLLATSESPIRIPDHRALHIWRPDCYDDKIIDSKGPLYFWACSHRVRRNQYV